MTINEVRELEGMGTLDVPLPVSPVENTNNADGTQRI
jgi:hypothetical protein